MAFNSTIISKKRKLACGCFDYAFSKNRCKQHATIESTNKRIEKYEEGIEQESRKNLIEDLDIYFSRYIRIKHSDREGYVKCFTSGRRMRWEELQCGHYISRSHLSTRWLDLNCRPQSEHDNCALSGNLEVFKRKLDEERSGTSDYLLELSREVSKPSLEDLKQLLIEIKYKLKIAQSKFKK
jgi:Bacteriophage Lambda NinG protein